MPNLFTVSGYKVYFWANEKGEPIHVHVSKGKPSPNGTKIWLTKTGGCILASNGSNISRKYAEIRYSNNVWKEISRSGRVMSFFIFAIFP